MFTKRHYIEVAKVIRKSGAKGLTLSNLIFGFGRMFADDNPQFDWGRWKEACEDGTIRQRKNTRPRALEG